MKISLSALQAAFREHVSVTLAAALPTALAGLRGAGVAADALLDDGEVGEVLLRALTARAEPPSLELQFVQVETATERFKLEPAAAYDHPVLTGWIETTAAEALGRPFIIGVRRHDVSPFCPAHDSVALLSCEAGFTAAVAIRFGTREGQMAAVARYGVELPPAAATTTTAITGLALSRAGRAARAAADVETAPEPREEAEPLAMAPQAAGTVH